MYPVGIRTHGIFFGVRNFLLVIPRLELGRVCYLYSSRAFCSYWNRSAGSLRTSFTQDLSHNNLISA